MASTVLTAILSRPMSEGDRMTLYITTRPPQLPRDLEYRFSYRRK